ncbi:MAG: hypothetical protein O3A30_03845 [Bacteroidetes bacterium]|nr:hypothetical protein [Bacteroidota bacterium]
MSHLNFIGLDDRLSVFGATGLRRTASSLSETWLTYAGTHRVTDTEILSIDNYSLEVSPTNSTTPVVLTIDNVRCYDEDSEFASFLIGHAQFKSNSPLEVTGRLTLKNQPLPEGVAEATATTTRLAWSTGRTNKLLMPTENFDELVTCTFTLSGHGGASIFVTLPAVHDTFSFLDNPYVLEARKYMPDMFWNIDSQQRNPQFPMFKLIDVLSHSSSEAMETYSNIFEYDISELSPVHDATSSWVKSSLTDADYHNPSYRTWLGQFTGSEVRKNIVYRPTTIEDWPLPRISTPVNGMVSHVYQNYEPIEWITGQAGGPEYIDALVEKIRLGEVGANLGSNTIELTPTDGFLPVPSALFSPWRLNQPEAVVWKYRTTGANWKYVWFYDNPAGSWWPAIFLPAEPDGSQFTVPTLGDPDGITHPITSYPSYSGGDHFSDPAEPSAMINAINGGDPNFELDVGFVPFSGNILNGPCITVELHGGQDVDFETLLNNLNHGDAVYVDDTSAGSGVVQKAKYIYNGDGDGWFYSSDQSAYVIPTLFRSPSDDTAQMRAVYEPVNVSFGYIQDPVSFYATEEGADGFERWQIGTSNYGYNAGTGQSIREAAQLVLSGSQRVAILPNYLDEPFIIEVRTIDVETPEVDPATSSSPLVMAAIEPTRPAGYSFVSTTADDFYFTLGSPGLGLLGYAVLA